MTREEAGDGKPPLGLEEILSTALAVAAERDLAAMARRLGTTLHAWAAPTMIVCVQKDPEAEAGWRVLPQLTSGQVPAGFERSLAKLVEQSAPGSLSRPLLVRPGEEFSGLNVKLRDSWLVPWACGEASGFVLLRGIARPYPANLADAVALASQPLWPFVCDRAGRLKRLEEVAREARRLSDELRGEVREMRAAPQEPEAEELRRVILSLQHRIESFEKDLASSEEQRERAESEAAELRDQVEALERKLEAERARVTAAEEVRGEASQLSQRIAALERERSEAEAAWAREKTGIEKARAGEAEAARRQVGGLEEKVAALEAARVEAEADRNRAKAKVNELWSTIESLQREVRRNAERFEADKATLRAATDKDRDATREEARAAGLAAEEAARKAQEEARKAEADAREAREETRRLAERWERTTGTFRSALNALRRTPFVPPTLRVSVAAVEPLLEPAEGEAGRKRAKPTPVLLLDRDVASLDALALELESAGLEVLIAHYPDEVGFFLKTPDSRRVAAVICDVMAFRSDRDLLESFRAWRQDLPGAAFLLSFKSESASEAERAKLVPGTIASGYVPRPMQRQAVLDAVARLGPAASPSIDKKR